MTYPRLFALVELHKRKRGRELYEVGLAVNLAMNEPKRLKDFLPKKEIRLEDVPAMLRPAKKREPNG